MGNDSASSKSAVAELRLASMTRRISGVKKPLMDEKKYMKRVLFVLGTHWVNVF